MTAVPDQPGRRIDGPSWTHPITEPMIETTAQDPTAAAGDRDDEIRTVVARLARRHPSGDVVIERAAILAEGADCSGVVAWIVAHDGRPEQAVAPAQRGLHGPRLSDQTGADRRAPLRYVLPADAIA
jgi:hypothetical protein